MRTHLVPLLLAAAAIAALGQGTTARFVGQVADATGAILPKTTVTATHVATGRDYTTTTDAGGRYVLPLLPVGQYTLRAELAGFRKLVRDGLVLQIDQTAEIDLVLQVGEVTQSLNVTSEAPTIATETTDIGSVVDNQQVSEMPLNGRLNIVALLVLAPGVQDLSDDQSGVPVYGINPQIGGGGTKTAAYSLDGASNTENNNVRGGGNWPSLEAVQEFKVTTSNASAEFGKGGSQIIMVSKSGTNQFHGSALWYNRNRVLAAQNALVKLAEKPGFNRNEYGISQGGPVVLPHFNGKDHTFFFFAWEAFKLRSPFATTQSLATAAMRNGDFSAVTAIRDPLNGVAFPGNLIPASRISPVAAKLQSFYPFPNTPGTAVGGTGTNYVTALRNEQNVMRMNLKIDHRFSSRDQLAGRFLYSNLGPNPNTTANAIFTVAGVEPERGQIGERMRSVLLSETHVVTNRLINDFRGSYRYQPVFRTPRYNRFDPATVIPGLISPTFGGLPTLNISGFMSMTDTLPGSRDKDYDLQLIDSLTWSQGKHLVKVGYEAEWVDHFNIYNINAAVPNPSGGTITPNRGALVFNNRYSGTRNGNAWADFLLGYPVITANPGVAPPTQWRSWRQYAYIQDDVKVRRNLTLNLGLRYEYQPKYRSRFREAATFNPQRNRVVVFGDEYPATASAAMIASLPISLAKNVGLPASLSDYLGETYTNFGPRFGFAWTPFKRLVFRGGYGIYYMVMPMTAFKDTALFGANPPFAAVQTYESGATTPVVTLANPFPGNGSFTANPTLGAMAQGIRSPISQQWNFTMEYDLRGTALRASYVGNMGTHELGTYDVNAAPAVAAAVQPRRPYQPFSSINWISNPYSHITHQMQLGAKRVYRRGLTFQANYQFTRALGIESYDNPFDGRISYGNLSVIRRHALVGSYVYMLPFGKGRALLNHTPVVTAIATGWELTGIPALYSGAPFSPSFSQGTAGCPGGRPNIVGDPIPAHRTVDQWFLGSAYKAPTGCAYGAAAPYSLFGPATFKWDTGVYRNVKVREKVNLQIRFEAFNVLNHPVLGTPQANISSANVGRITSASGERQMQTALKLSW
jgi:hypothetical protein